MDLSIPQKSPNITEVFIQLLDKAQEFMIGVKSELFTLFDKGLVFAKKKKRGKKGWRGSKGRGPFPKNPGGKGPNGPKPRGKRGGGGS